MRSFVLSSALLLVGCDGQGGAMAADGPAGSDGPAGAADAAPRPDSSTAPVLGSVRLAETAMAGPGGWQGVRATASLTTDGLPDWHTDVASEGACRLRRHQLGNCTGCEGLCLAPDECRPYPTFLDGGELAFTGVRGSVDLDYYEGAGYFLASQPPADVFDAGATVGVSAPGADFAAFTVETPGVAPLVANLPVDAYGILALPEASDATFTWTAGSGDDRVRLTLSSQTQGHGLPATAMIVCEGPDSGSLTVPGALLAQFPATRTAAICVGVDCPASVLGRVSRGTSADGSVELLVESATEFWIDHPVE